MQRYSFLFILLAALAFVGLANATTPTIPSGIQYYVAVNITNSQTTATPSPFQQMINITESTFSNYIAYNNNFANFEYFYANGTIIPAWIESNSSGKLITWVKLTPSIAASGKLTIYLGFASKTTNLLSSSGTSGIGEAPQLSSTYAQYDDGASVFNNYWNFAGTTLPSGLSLFYFQNPTSGGSYSQNNGISFDSSGINGYGVVATTSLTSPYVVETLGYTTASGGSSGARPALIFTASSSSNNPSQVEVDQGGFGENAWDVNYYSGGTSGSFSNLGSFGSTLNANQYFQMSAMVNGGNYNIAAVPQGSSSAYSYSSYSYTNQGGYYGIGTELTTSGITFYWLRTRAYPPNGVMPSVSFGSVQQAPSQAPSLSISPNPATYGQSITITATCPQSTDTCAIDYPSLGTHIAEGTGTATCLLYTSPSPRDRQKSRMPSSA